MNPASLCHQQLGFEDIPPLETVAEMDRLDRLAVRPFARQHQGGCSESHHDHPPLTGLFLLLVGAVLTPRQRTVAASLRIMGRSGHRDYARYHEVLNRAVWSFRARWPASCWCSCSSTGRWCRPLVFNID